MNGFVRVETVSSHLQLLALGSAVGEAGAVRPTTAAFVLDGGVAFLSECVAAHVRSTGLDELAGRDDAVEDVLRFSGLRFCTKH